MSARDLPWAGLAAGPAAWAVATQLQFAIAPWTCAKGGAHLIVPGVALLLAAVAVVGGILSWRSWRALPALPLEVGGRPRHFLAALGTVAAMLFALAILMQGAGGLVFSGCEW